MTAAGWAQIAVFVVALTAITPLLGGYMSRVYQAGEPHSNKPGCVSPVLRAFCTRLNDALDDEPRQRMLPYLDRTIGTTADGLDETRSWMALDWLIRVYAPTWLDAAGLSDSANRLTTLSPVVGMPDLKVAIGALGGGRRDSRAAWAEVLGAARAVAWLGPNHPGIAAVGVRAAGPDAPG
jgi:hypothetical protein